MNYDSRLMAYEDYLDKYKDPTSYEIKRSPKLLAYILSIREEIPQKGAMNFLFELIEQAVHLKMHLNKAYYYLTKKKGMGLKPLQSYLAYFYFLRLRLIKMRAFDRLNWKSLVKPAKGQGSPWYKTQV